MTQPPGFIDKDRPTHVCRLRKAIYGLKQVPCVWYMALKQHLTSTGFHISQADDSLFTRIVDGTYTYLLIYVDDIIVTGTTTLSSTWSSTFFQIGSPLKTHLIFTIFLVSKQYAQTRGYISAKRNTLLIS